jgi:putative oxidoreductase
VPFPRFSLAAGTAFQIAAGTLLILGMFVVPSAFGLIVFTAAATLMMLNFWDMEGEIRVWCVNNWLSNIGIIGGLLVVAAQA